MSKNQFTGTETQPHRNRKLCQFNKDQYCIYMSQTNLWVLLILTLYKQAAEFEDRWFCGPYLRSK